MVTRPSRCSLCDVRAQTICSALSSDALLALSAVGRSISLAPGELLQRQGEALSSVGIVKSGALRLTKSLPDGREQMLGLALPGDFVGHPLKPLSGLSQTALNATRLCTFDQGTFERLLRIEPAFQHRLLLWTFDQLDAARRWQLLLGRASATERLASFLLDLAARCAGEEGRTVALQLTRQQIGDLLGLSIETVSRKLGAFARNGIITLPRRGVFTVRDMARLQSAAA